jgi:hypothetical protein
MPGGLPQVNWCAHLAACADATRWGDAVTVGHAEACWDLPY